MNKEYVIALIMLLLAGLITCSMSVYKRKVVLSFGGITWEKAKSLSFWVTVFTDYRIILILLFMALVFVLNIVVFSFLEVNKITILNWALSIPFFLFTIFLSNKILDETITKGQYLGIGFMILSTIIGIVGAYLYYKA